MGDCCLFWHIYIDFEYPDVAIQIVQRQWNKIKESGLIERCLNLYIGYVGCVDFPIPEIIEHPRVEIIRRERYGFESVTTNELKRICDNKSEDIAILYFHNRGSTRRSSHPTQDWTIMLEEFTITRWMEAMELLKNYSTVGCELCPQPDRHVKDKVVYHYSGNFWWARADYIKTLPYPKSRERFDECETWLLQSVSSEDLCNHGILHRTGLTKYKSDIDIYTDRYLPEYYSSFGEIPDIPVKSSLHIWGQKFWENDFFELKESVDERLKILEDDPTKKLTMKGHNAMIEIGFYYGVSHDYEKAMKCLDFVEQNSYRYSLDITQWIIYKRLLCSYCSQTMEEEQLSVKKLCLNFEDLMSNFILNPIRNIAIMSHSFWYAYLDINPKILYQKYAYLQQKFYPSIARTDIRPNGSGMSRIRLGIISKALPIDLKDVHASSISDSFYETLSRLDSLKFEVLFIHVGSTKKVQRIDNHICVPNIDSLEVVKVAQDLLLDLKLDIVLYLEVHMNSELNYLMHTKVAPIQVCTHGHPVTTGLPREIMDYYLSWEAAEISEAQYHYTEKLVLIPKDIVWEYYTPRNTPERISSKTGIMWGTITRETLALNLGNTQLDPTKRWYFCAQAAFKYGFEFSQTIQKILMADREALFIMINTKRETYQFDDRLRKRLISLDVPMDRVICLDKMEHHNLMAMYNVCDVVLDSFFFGGDTTTREAFETGAPVITLPSKYLGGRWTQAYYKHMKIYDFIARDVDHYVEISIKIANLRNEEKDSLRKKISDASTCLFYSEEAPKAWGNALESLTVNSL
tara:strand:+ start:1844 stop:4246 length:2403 start_codon:yes stop_codon:yes gene_type:complete